MVLFGPLWPCTARSWSLITGPICLGAVQPHTSRFFRVLRGHTFTNFTSKKCFFFLISWPLRLTLRPIEGSRPWCCVCKYSPVRLVNSTACSCTYRQKSAEVLGCTFCCYCCYLIPSGDEACDVIRREKTLKRIFNMSSSKRCKKPQKHFWSDS